MRLAPMPAAWEYVVLADRWHVPPWEIEQAPADRYYYFRALLVVEADARSATHGLPPHERVIRDDG